MHCLMKHFFEGIAPLMNWYLHTWNQIRRVIKTTSLFWLKLTKTWTKHFFLLSNIPLRHLLFLNTKPSFVYALTHIACEVNDWAQSMTKYNLSFINQRLFLFSEVMMWMTNVKEYYIYVQKTSSKKYAIKYLKT